jgi:hypothetical protein
MEKETVLEIKEDVTTHQKNTDGHLGPICNNCGGFGFTLTFGGVSNSAGCKDCDQTGVASMTNAQLQKEVIGMKQELAELKNIIINALKEKSNV